MSNVNDGGPAFPVPDAATWQGHGMSLRDYFAAKAMQTLLAGELPRYVPKDEENLTVSQWVCKRAYTFADAMLKARGEEK